MVFVKIFVARSKTDVYREGNYVYIAKLENKFYPLVILGRYIKAGVAKTKTQKQRPKTKTPWTKND